jgi:hypothetical protein
MPERRNRSGLTKKANPFQPAGILAGQDHLQCHAPSETQVQRAIDDTHAPATEHGFDAVAGHLR